MKRGFWYIITGLLLAACSQQPELEVTLHECSPIPSPRACATAFVANGDAYIFAGRDSLGQALNDLWRYDAETDTWTSLGQTPLSPRVNATACVTDEKVYIGLGFKGKYGVDSCYMRDWWEYEPATNQWTRLADYPNSYSDKATSFAGDGELYVGYGFCWNYRRDMFRYTIAENRWDSIDVQAGMFDYPTRSFGGTGCTCQHRHFMGSGYYRHSLDWWAELVDGKHWEERTPIPGKTRTLAASAATENHIYVTCGLHYGGVNTTGDVLRDIRRYDPMTDKWQYVAVLQEGMYNHCCFVIGKRVFVGLGEGLDEKITSKLYWFEE